MKFKIEFIKKKKLSSNSGFVKVDAVAGVDNLQLSTDVQTRSGNHIVTFLISRGAGWFNRDRIIIRT